MTPSIKENTKMTHTPTPWKVLWKHDTHKVRRDKQGRIIDNVIVPFEDYVHAMHCVNTHDALVEALQMVESCLASDDNDVTAQTVRKALAAAKGAL